MDNIEFEKYRENTLNSPPTEQCPVYKTLKLFQGKWTVRVLFELSKIDNARFGELKRMIIGITNTMLTSTLKDLEEKELINRIQFNEVPPHVEYSLTDREKALFPVFEAMAVWGTQYL